LDKSLSAGVQNLNLGTGMGLTDSVNGDALYLSPIVVKPPMSLTHFDQFADLCIVDFDHEFQHGSDALSGEANRLLYTQRLSTFGKSSAKMLRRYFITVRSYLSMYLR
jgi:hypothetical protein